MISMDCSDDLDDSIRAPRIHAERVSGSTGSTAIFVLSISSSIAFETSTTAQNASCTIHAKLINCLFDE